MEKRKLLKLCLMLCLCVTQPAAGTMRYSLSGSGWKFGQARLDSRYPATVPGVVHTDLMANGIIADPYHGLNERNVQWIDKEDWVYETSFTPSDSLLRCDNIELVFEGLDTYADVFLNEEKIMAADNMFRIWRTDVRHYIKKGVNTLKVLFHSPIKIDMPKWESLPYQYRASNDQSENGGVFDRKLSVFARKAGYHYGWDWGPRLVTSGIWRDVYLDGWSDACIRNVHVRQLEVTKKKAVISNVVEIEASSEMKNAVISVKDKHNGQILATGRRSLSKGLNKIALDFSIRNPRLWWCNGLGKPELYTFTTTVSCGDSITLSHDERVGLRSVRIVTDPDTEGHMQFYFVLNGVPVFAKGTNYIPQDNFLPSVTDDRYAMTLHDATAANMNMIRIWGGGIYENDVFYDLCDELGLMVWQDFMFACSMYPATGKWLENMKSEARDNIRRLRNHPSVVIWCGGNECLDAWYNWGWKGKQEKVNPEHAQEIEEQMNRQYFEALPEMMSEHAPDSFYWPSSPFSGKGKGSDGLNGDRHYYGVWQRKHPVAQYNQEKSHFFSEYGVQSFPEYSTVLRFAPDTTQHCLESDVMMWHQRGGNHANGLIAWYLENEYRKPANFREMLYLNQVFQGDAMRTAIEAHRRNMPYCMGSLLWQHDDCWPVASWSTRDYYGKWKAAHYMVRRAFENVIVSSEITSDSIHVYTVSDLVKGQPGHLSITLYSLEGKKLWEKEAAVTVPANTSAIVWSGNLKSILGDAERDRVVFNLHLSTKDYSHEGNFYLCRQSELKFPKADVSYEVTPVADGYSIALRSTNFVRALCLSVDGGDEQFDDNYFDLIPGKSKTCTVQTTLSPDEFKSRLNITTCN